MPFSDFLESWVNVLCVEALAAHEGLWLAERLGLSHLLVLFDSLTLVQILRGCCDPLVDVSNYVATILGLASTFESVCFQHISRSHNLATNSLAQDCFSMERMLSMLHFLVGFGVHVFI